MVVAQGNGVQSVGQNHTQDAAPQEQRRQQELHDCKGRGAVTPCQLVASVNGPGVAGMLRNTVGPGTRTGVVVGCL